jgi:glycosyltransferase involved in cell wall biosynthesis
MKILAVIDTLGRAGAEHQLMWLVEALGRHGIQSETAALMPPYTLAGEFESRGIPVHRLDVPHRWAIHVAASRLARLADERGCDAVMAMLYFSQVSCGFMRAFKRRRPLVFAIQSSGYTNSLYQGVWPWFRARIHGWACRRADMTVACSKAVAEDYRNSLGVRGLQVIYNAIPHDILPGPLPEAERHAVRESYGVPPGVPLISIAARYSREKGHTYLLDALSILARDFDLRPYCIAAGHGPLHEQLIRRTSELSLDDRVKFVGSLEQRQMHRLMQASDVAVLPSLQEPFGLAAVESMALGTPTIITRHYGLAEVADDSAAFTVAPRDPVGLADALRRALTDEAERSRIATNGMARAKVFTIERIAGQWADALLSLRVAATRN